MAAAEFTWVQPVGGKSVVWRTLKVGDQMDLDANYGRSDVAYLKKYAQYAMRVVRFDDNASKRFDVNDFRDWDDYDLDAFADEVMLQEATRANALSSKRPGSPVANLERSVEAAQLAVAKAGEALKAVLSAAKATEQQLGPLTQGGSS